MATAAVITHIAFEDLGIVGPILQARGLTVTVYDAATDDFSSAADADLLVILGGPISVNDRADYPFLDQEVALVKERLGRDLPTLGLCLGSQVMAAALGAPIYAAQAKEIGWSTLTLTPEGAAVMPELKDVPVLHWHGETFDLPAGAILLASTATTPHQVFSHGRSLAMQCHPEVTQMGMERWFIGHTGEISATSGIDVPSLRAATAQHAPAMEKAGTAFFTKWLASIGF